MAILFTTDRKEFPRETLSYGTGGLLLFGLFDQKCPRFTRLAIQKDGVLGRSPLSTQGL